MIKELLKKDAVMLMAMLAAGLVAHFSLYVDAGFEHMWVWPNPRFYDNAFVLHFIFGIALGLCIGLRDEVTRTQEFLWHRPVSRKLVFGTRMLAGFGIMVCWLVLPLCAAWIIEGWGNPNKVMADGGRAWLYLSYGTITFACFAAACFAASWPGHWLLRFTLGATPSLLILLACFGEPFPYASPAEHPVAAAMLLLVATALLLYAAWHNELGGRDPDHPVSTPALRWSVSLAAVAGCVLCVAGLTELQRQYSNETRRWYPSIAAAVDGGYYLRGINPETWPDVFEYMVYDQQHRVVRPAPDPDSQLPLPWSPHYLRAGVSRLTAPRRAGLIELGRISFYVRCFLNPADGHAYVVTISGRGQADRKPSRRALAKGPDKKRFSHQARKLGNAWDSLAMVWDEDGIWAYDLDGTADFFHLVPLPNNDRVVNWTTPSGHLVPILGLDDKRLVVLGEKGRYGWTGKEFTEVHSAELPSWFRPRVEAVVEKPDPFVFTAVVPGAFRHDYDLYTWREKVPATLAMGVSVLRLPLFQVQSFLRSKPRFSGHRFALTDPLLAGHKRFWLLGLNLLLAVVLTVLATRRLARLGVPRGRMLCWAIAIAPGGLPLFLYYRFTETDRAWRQAPILKPEEIPPMWIKSA